MSGAMIKVEGLEAIKKKIGNIPKTVITETNGIMAVVAKDFANKAINDAPEYNREIIAGITEKKNAEMDWEVVSHAPHSAYLEFGTKSRFKAIPGIDSSQFKGKGSGGGLFEMYKAILEWVTKKGIASRWSLKTHKPIKATKADSVRIQETASAIAISILRHGIHPHPFFYKQLPAAQSQIQEGMKKVVEQALK